MEDGRKDGAQSGAQEISFNTRFWLTALQSLRS